MGASRNFIKYPNGFSRECERMSKKHSSNYFRTHYATGASAQPEVPGVMQESLNGPSSRRAAIVTTGESAMAKDVRVTEYDSRGPGRLHYAVSGPVNDPEDNTLGSIATRKSFSA